MTLSLENSRERQQRLLEVLSDRKLDAAVCGFPAHVYYFTAFLPHWTHQSAVVVFADGSSWLTTPNEPAERAAADRIVSYEASYLYTLRQEQPAIVADQVLEVLKDKKTRRVGIDASLVTSQVALGFEGPAEPIDANLWRMRRKKDPDELELMKGAIRCTQAMHRRAREIVEPGVSELHVFGELHATAVKTAGEPMTALLGNDYACGQLGGPPRKDHLAAAGEIYILDLGPAYRGYFADNTRAIAVNRRPTDAQIEAWQTVTAALQLVEGIARPGIKCRELYETVEAHFKEKRGTGLRHHLGHGVGLQPHEYPHLNPHWDDVLMEGEVVSVEPGLYGAGLAGGIRLENQYLVTADGIKNLVDAPLELT